jgi:hypothetical protein
MGKECTPGLLHVSSIHIYTTVLVAKQATEKENAIQAWNFETAAQ